MTPTAWKKGGHKEYSQTILAESKKAIASNANYNNIEATIVNMPQIEVYYMRHNGYNDQIKQTWQKVQTWTYSNNIKDYEHIALFHDNPTVTHLEECQYVACIKVNDKSKIDYERLPKLNIAKGVYAKFDITGADGDFLHFLYWVYTEWLPNSEYETTTQPPYAIYKKNKYLSDDNHFDLSFYLSIKF
ncbi:AraC family transcriptional regulator [Sulfurimonas sp. NW9]